MFWASRFERSLARWLTTQLTRCGTLSIVISHWKPIYCSDINLNKCFPKQAEGYCNREAQQCKSIVNNNIHPSSGLQKSFSLRLLTDGCNTQSNGAELTSSQLLKFPGGEGEGGRGSVSLGRALNDKFSLRI